MLNAKLLGRNDLLVTKPAWKTQQITEKRRQRVHGEKNASLLSKTRIFRQEKLKNSVFSVVKIIFVQQSHQTALLIFRFGKNHASGSSLEHFGNRHMFDTANVAVAIFDHNHGSIIHIANTLVHFFAFLDDVDFH